MSLLFVIAALHIIVHIADDMIVAKMKPFVSYKSNTLVLCTFNFYARD